MRFLFLVIMLVSAFICQTGNAFAQQIESQKTAEAPLVIMIEGDETQSVTSIRGTVTENSERIRQRAKMTSRGGMIASMAKRYIGVPYRWAGTTASGFDCSGFVMAVYAKSGINIKRLADEQFYHGKRIQREELSIGDLVFFETYTYGISHVGIYVGNNRFIHSSSSRGVTIDNLDDPYFKVRYRGACRY